jgi:hypothetical protein
MDFLVKRWQRFGPKTAVAGTPWVLGIPSSDFGRAIINRLTILNGATANVLSIMQVKGRDKVTVGGATGQAKFKIASANPCGIAVNDWLGIVGIDGTVFYDVVSAVAAPSGGNIEITMTANLAKAVEADARIFFFDLPAIHEQITLPTTAETTYQSDYGYFGADEIGDPILLHCNNATNATTLKAAIAPIIGV